MAPRVALAVKPRVDCDIEVILHEKWRNLLPLLEALASELPAFLSGRDFNSYLSWNGSTLVVRRPRPLVFSGNQARPPVLWLDATPNTRLLMAVLGGYQLHRRALVASPRPDVRVSQHMRVPTGKTGLKRRKNLDALKEELLRIAGRIGPSDGVAVYRDYKTAMLEMGFLLENIVTWGQARGTNRLQGVARLFVIGRPQPPFKEELWPLSEALSHEDEHSIEGEIVYATRRFDGLDWEGSYLDFMDERAAEVLAAHREAEVYQAVHRARLVSRTSPLEVHLLQSVPIPGLRVDELNFESDSTSENERRHEEAFARIELALSRLAEQGTRPSQRAVCKLASTSSGTYAKYQHAKRKREPSPEQKLIHTLKRESL